MKLSREDLLSLYRQRLANNSLEHLAWPTSDRELSPAELSHLDFNCYKTEEKDELDQQAPYPP